MRYLLFLFFLGCISIGANAQIAPANPVAADINMRQLAELGTRMSAVPIGFDNRYEGVKGSPYLYEKWRPGEIQVDGAPTISENIFLNIDGTKNLATVQLPNGVLGLQNEKIKGLVINIENGSVRYETHLRSKIEGKGDGKVLLEVLYDGVNYGYYKEPRIVFNKANYQGAYSPDVRYDEYVASPVYFIRVKDKYEKVKLKKNAIQKIIPEIRRTEGWKGTELTEQKLIVLLAELSHKN